MQRQPLYDQSVNRPAYQLRYTWTGWPSVPPLPIPSAELWEAARAAWEEDGLRVLETSTTTERMLITFSARPDVIPVTLASRAKGRLQHLFRKIDGGECRFSRKVSIRSVGDNCTEEIRHYIERQVEKEQFVDPAFEAFVKELTVIDENVDLSVPTATLSGRYGYNLHLVLVTDGRFRLADEQRLTLIRDRSFRIATKKGYSIAALSVMPDHLHMALRGNLEHSPQEIALAFQNNLAYALDSGMIWQPSYYVGTFGDYNMNAIRWYHSKESSSPAGQAGRGRGTELDTGRG